MLACVGVYVATSLIVQGGFASSHRVPQPVALFGSSRHLAPLLRKLAQDGGNLAAVNHEDAVEISLTGGQRRTLRNQGKSLEYIPVADVTAAVGEVQELLQEELIKCKFVTCEKKPAAQLQANELAAMTGAAVAECIGNECLLYRPPSAGQPRKYML